MKKNKSLFFILIALIAATVIFIFRKNDSTIRNELKEFAVKDTAAITKIFLTDRNGNSITLDRKDRSTWLLNGNKEPRMENVRFLLDGIYQLQIKTKVANAAYNNVIKMLASTGIKCEIYLHNEEKPYKVYYVGGQTEDALGTFMMIENSSAPFITEVPGFNGYLTPRYSTSLDSWKSTKLLSLAPSEIKEVTVKYSSYPEKSFTIRSENGRYNVMSPATATSLPHVDSVAVDNYLAFYRHVFYESVVNNLSSAARDSMLKFPPAISLSVTDVRLNQKSIDIYPMPLNANSLTRQDSLGNELKYDVDRMYALIKPENELVIIQHYSFDNLLRQLNDFSFKTSRGKF